MANVNLHAAALFLDNLARYTKEMWDTYDYENISTLQFFLTCHVWAAYRAYGVRSICLLHMLYFKGHLSFGPANSFNETYIIKCSRCFIATATSMVSGINV